MDEHYVIAGSYAQAVRWAAERLIPRTALRYITRLDQLRGRLGLDIVLTDTYLSSPVLREPGYADMIRAGVFTVRIEPTIPEAVPRETP